MSPRGFGFLIVATTILASLAYYVVKRVFGVTGWRALPDGQPPRRLVLGATVVLAATMALPWLTRIQFTRDNAWSDTLAGGGFLVVLGTLLSAALLFAVDGPRALGAWALRRRVRLPSAGSEMATPALVPEPELAVLAVPSDGASSGQPEGRRSFVVRALHGAAVTVGSGHAAYATFVGRHDYVIEERTVPIRDLPAALEGISIAQISDLHVGTFVGERELDAALDLLRRARPDVIAMTGDLVDYDLREARTLGLWARRVAELGPRFGTFAVPGNHDYYTGVDAVLDTLGSAGVTVLRNDARAIEDGPARLALLGVDDVWAERDNWGTRYDLEAAIARAPRDCPRVLLCHNPERFASVAGQVDLQLSGHTHGGQVNLVVRPIDVFVRHGFVAGHYVRGGAQLYVNRGFGTVGPPARLHAPPEITKLTLVRA